MFNTDSPKKGKQLLLRLQKTGAHSLVKMHCQIATQEWCS